jgi:hypothetical protein
LLEIESKYQRILSLREKLNSLSEILIENENQLSEGLVSDARFILKVAFPYFNHENLEENLSKSLDAGQRIIKLCVPEKSFKFTINICACFNESLSSYDIPFRYFETLQKHNFNLKLSCSYLEEQE